MTHPLFELVRTTTGATSIRDRASGEIMHNPVGPWLEANALYIDQSDLRARLQVSGRGELVVFDVGLGAGSNALAVLHCVASAAQVGACTRTVRLVSFEQELELLRFALANAKSFAHFSGFEEIVFQFLQQGCWSSAHVIWELRAGDFLQTIVTEPTHPHLIFFDPYSPKVNPLLWTCESFRRLRSLCRGLGEPSLLLTYSQSTSVRVELLRAGFFVGHGMAIGRKEETTLASTELAALAQPLGQKWLKRFQGSHRKTAFECSADELAQIEQFVNAHPQLSWPALSINPDKTE